MYTECAVEITCFLEIGNWSLVVDCSIDHALDEPGIRVALAEDAIGRTVAERHVPLVAIPAFAAARLRLGRLVGGIHPPPARGSPRSRVLLDRSTTEAATIDDDAHRDSALDANAHWYRKSKPTHRELWCRRRAIHRHRRPRHGGTEPIVLCVSESLRRVAANVVGIAGGEWCHFERARFPRINSDRGSAAPFTHQRREPCHQCRQLLRRWERPCEQRE